MNTKHCHYLNNFLFKLAFTPFKTPGSQFKNLEG